MLKHTGMKVVVFLLMMLCMCSPALADAVILPEGLKTVSDYMLEGCASMTELVLPESIASIGEGAFKDCAGLRTVTFPSGIRSIGKHAFYGCKALKRAYMPFHEFTIADEAFAACTDIEFIVARGSFAESFCKAHKLNYSYYQPSEIVPPVTKLELGVGEETDLSGWRILPEGAEDTISFTTSDESVASVTAAGKVSAVDVGSAVITLKGESGISAKIPVTVKDAPSSIYISSFRSPLGVGESSRLACTLSSGSTGSISYASSNESILSVDADGVVTAHKAGQVTVSATAYNGVRAIKTINVLSVPESITIIPKNAAIGAGDTLKAVAVLSEGSAGKCSYKSSNDLIASVNADTGLITARSEGEAVITCSVYNGLSASLKLRVLPAFSGLTIAGLKQNAQENYLLQIDKGASYPIKPEAGEYTHIGCTYVSSNPDVVSVSSGGLATANHSGDAYIDVTAYNGETARIHVIVQTISQRFPVKTIMHAMGAIGGKTYSNSIEAFKQNYAKGHRFFEVDLSYTSDGHIVLWHSWEKNRINSSTKEGYVPTLAEFRSKKIYDKYTSMDLEALLRLMADYPDAYFFMDTKLTGSGEVRTQYRTIVSTAKELGLSSVLDRMVVMIYNKPMYSVVSGIYPFRQYVYMMYKEFSEAPTSAQVKDIATFCASNNIEYISMWGKWWKPSFMDIARQYGLEVNLHTISSSSDAKKFISQGVTLITSDTLPPSGY